MNVYDGSGKLISLGSKIGCGGEGSIYAVNKMPGLAAKIYHAPVNDKKRDKLISMVKIKDERLLGISAWPVDTLHTAPEGPICGILIPRVEGYKEIHKLFSPKDRIVEFPHAGWDFLIHTASNLARAFSVIHRYGHVIGDVNQGNILISNKGTVMLIDCDSYQITDGSHVYTCEVGISMYQPPELQDIKSYAGILRTQCHDNFGLAVLIFQLLFMGRHPFSGIYDGHEEVTLEKAIKEHRFFYLTAGSNKTKQPPSTLTLDSITGHLRTLFERAFLSDSRPEAREWAEELGNLLKQLKQCAFNPSHRYMGKLKECPWCRIENKTGVKLFSMVAGFNNLKQIQEIDDIPLEIDNIHFSLSRHHLSDIKSIHAWPAREFIKYRNLKRISITVFCISSVWFLLFAAGITENHAGGIVAIFLSIASAVWIKKAIPYRIRYMAKMNYNEAKSNFDKNMGLWMDDAWKRQLSDKCDYLLQLFGKYKELENIRSKKIRDLQLNKRKYQLDRYLGGHGLFDSGIKGLPPNCRMTLHSYGIKSAADMEYEKLKLIPELSCETANRLLKWRKELEDKFTFNPKASIHRTMVDEIDREYLDERNKIIPLLLSHLDEVRQLYKSEIHRVEELSSDIQSSASKLAQAEINLKALWGINYYKHIKG